MRLSWNQFKIKNLDTTNAFEELCYFLFCRRYEQAEGIRADYNQVGLETYPIYSAKEKKWVGFQSKFFENKLSDASSKNQIIKSITKAKKHYPKLQKIILYTHQSFGSENPEYKLEIEKNANKIEIEWITHSNFKVILQQPKNLDLLQTYFGQGNEHAFIKNFSDPYILTFLHSSEYLSLPFNDYASKKNIKNIRQALLTNKAKTVLISGHPGSGKSYFMHHLLRAFSGIDQVDAKKMTQVILKQKAIPMLINLKDCVGDTLENIIRNRKQEFGVSNQKIIYLIDGLDELDSERADSVLSFMVRLSNGEKTKKIIISCRTGNMNKLKAHIYFSDLQEYRIGDLTKKDIENYFNNKTPDKSKTLSAFTKENKALIKRVNDILLVKLLWDTIENLDKEAAVVDLIDNKMQLLLNQPAHKKNIEELDLLDPKPENILRLNEEIAYSFQEKYHFRLPRIDIQEHILKVFPRLGYKEVNKILNYIADVFLDSPSIGEKHQTYIYQHRRYQEYFFVLALKNRYEQDPRILRDLKVISNHELFEELFLPFLRKNYLREANLVRLMELNLINVYLGHHTGFGADDPYYMNSYEFLLAVACQDDDLFEQLVLDESFQVQRLISTGAELLEENFAKCKASKKEFRIKEYWVDVWEGTIPSLLQQIRIFWAAGKTKLAKTLIQEYKQTKALYKKYQKHIAPNRASHMKDPIWQRWEDWLFGVLVISEDDVKGVFQDLVRGNYDNFREQHIPGLSEEGKEKLIKSFLRISLMYRRKDLQKIIKSFDQYEMLSLLEILAQQAFIHQLISDKIFFRVVKKAFQELKIKELSKSNEIILFYKRLFGSKINKKEKKYCEERLAELMEERRVDWHMYKIHNAYSLLSFALDKNSFDDLLMEPEKDYLRYFFEQPLHAALYTSFIRLLTGKEGIEQVVRKYLSYVQTHDDRFDQFLQVDRAFLFANMFHHAKASIETLRNLKRILVKDDNCLTPYSFLLELKKIDAPLFDKLVSESEIDSYEVSFNKWDDDFSSYVDHCFQLASFYAHINKQKAIKHIANGLNEGAVRHGWRKDTIVSYQLVEAFEILWRNNWISSKEIEIYAEEVFDLTVRVYDVTDGKGTWSGPYNIIKLASKYDLTISERLLKKWVEKKGSYNVSNSALTYVILGKVRHGVCLKDVEEAMLGFNQSFDYEQKPDADYYEQKMRVYLAIAKSELHSENERKTAFEKACEQVEAMRKKEVKYFLRDIEFRKDKEELQALSQKYGKIIDLEYENDQPEYSSGKRTNVSETEFCKKIKKVKTKRQIQSIYSSLDNYETAVTLSKLSSWKLLLEKTYSVNKSIELFIKLLKEKHYPSTDFMTANSKYFHLALAVALKDVNMKEETLKYLYDHTGYGGFVNLMRSYEINSEKDMCRLLFTHFKKMCKFLVY